MHRLKAGDRGEALVGAAHAERAFAEPASHCWVGDHRRAAQFAAAEPGGDSGALLTVAAAGEVTVHPRIRATSTR